MIWPLIFFLLVIRNKTLSLSHSFKFQFNHNFDSNIFHSSNQGNLLIFSCIYIIKSSRFISGFMNWGFYKFWYCVCVCVCVFQLLFVKCLYIMGLFSLVPLSPCECKFWTLLCVILHLIPGCFHVAHHVFNKKREWHFIV